MLFIPLIVVCGALLAGAIYLVLLRGIRRGGQRAIDYANHQIDDPLDPTPSTEAQRRQRRLEDWDRHFEDEP